jgi:hypothetical protein
MNDIAILSQSSASVDPPAARPLALAELAAERGEHLPRDHPRQSQDAVSLCSRARELLAGMSVQPTYALSFWDHGGRSAKIGARRVSIDPSGSYKLE